MVEIERVMTTKEAKNLLEALGCDGWGSCHFLEPRDGERIPWEHIAFHLADLKRSVKDLRDKIDA